MPLHLIQRGSNRQVCFFAEENYRFYLDWLAKQAGRRPIGSFLYELELGLVDEIRWATNGNVVPGSEGFAAGASPSLATLH